MAHSGEKDGFKILGPLELQLRQRWVRGHILIRLLDLDRRHNLDPRHLGGLGLSLIVEGDLVVEGRGLSGFLEVSNRPRGPLGLGGPIGILSKHRGAFHHNARDRAQIKG